MHTHDLIDITKTKATTHYCESFGYGGKILLTHVSRVLTQVSVPVEDESNMPLVDQHFHAHSCP
jgi:hypothetical protein